MCSYVSYDMMSRWSVHLLYCTFILSVSPSLFTSLPLLLPPSLPSSLPWDPFLSHSLPPSLPHLFKISSLPPLPPSLSRHHLVSRSTLAHLHSAGFPELTDHQGHLLPSHSPSPPSPPPTTDALEERPFQIAVQLLACSLSCTK